MKTLIIRGFEDVGQLQGVEIIKKKGAHSVCTFELLAREDALFTLDGRIGTTVQIEDEDWVLMCGTVKEIRGCLTYLKTTLAVTVVSFSEQLDQEVADRIFQSPDKNYGQVAEKLSCSTVKIQILEESLRAAVEKRVLIQHGETNFAFLKRLAAEHGCGVFVNDTNRGQTIISVGTHTGLSSIVIDPGSIFELRFACNESGTYIKARLDALYEPGAILQLYGIEYIVESTHIKEENDRESFCYELVRTLYKEAERREASQSLALGRGKVVNNADPQHLGRIQVNFLDLEDCVTGELEWIPYLSSLTEGGGGILFLPDEGETVELLCRNGKCVAVGCVREVAVDADSQDTKERVLKIRNKRLAVSEDKAELAAHGHSVLLQEGMVRISNGSFNLELSDSLLSVYCGSTKINLNQDTLQLLAASALDIKAGQINLDGSSAINAKTSAFNIG